MRLKKRIEQVEKAREVPLSTPKDSPMAELAHRFFPNVRLTKRSAPLLAIDILRNGGDPSNPSDEVREMAYQDFNNRP